MKAADRAGVAVLFLAVAICVDSDTGRAWGEEAPAAALGSPKGQETLEPAALAPAASAVCATVEGQNRAAGAAPFLGRSQATLSLAIVNFQQAQVEMGTPESSQRNYGNIWDRQQSVPRPNNAAFDSTANGVTLSYVDAYSSVPQVLANLQSAARADLIVDSTRILAPGFLPTAFLPTGIPVPGNPTYATPPRSNLVNGNVAANLRFQTQATTAVGSARSMVELATFTQANGDQSLQVLSLYAQLNNAVVGIADSMFSDPDALPNTIDVGGPNAQVYMKHALIGYFLPFQISNGAGPSYYAAVSVEAPEASVSPPTPGAAGFNSFSHIPDFAAKLRWEDPARGHLQLAGILRTVAVENSPYTFHRETFGWGARFSGTYLPFRSVDGFENDLVSFSILYGHGIGNYVLDLRFANGYDAAFEPDGEIQALPVLSFFGGYSHYWTPNLRSAIVYSQVNCDSIPSQGRLAYRQGRYFAANLIYRWQLWDRPNPQGQRLQGFTGLEYLYGERDTLSGNSGNAHRMQFTLGASF